jgi:hypothetical protein
VFENECEYCGMKFETAEELANHTDEKHQE